MNFLPVSDDCGRFGGFAIALGTRAERRLLFSLGSRPFPFLAGCAHFWAIACPRSPKTRS